MPLLPTTSLQLDIPLRGNQIRNFRAAIIEATGRNLEMLHNKANNGESVNRYPLVQYRVKGGRAAVWAAGPGCDQFRQWLFQSQGHLQLGGRDIAFRVTDWKDDRFELRTLPADKPQWYYLNRWLPLHKDKYSEWLRAPNLSARIELMENQLVAHILSFAREVDWWLPERLNANLQQIVHTRKVKYHDNEFVGFDVVFTANAALPPGIGLGHAVSHGYGIATPVTAFTRMDGMVEKEPGALAQVEVDEL